MQKRVLAFLLVMAMVMSLLPVALVGAETETQTPAFTVIMQKAHNQTDGSLAIDVYLQSTVAAEVTGYQFAVTPAEGLTWTGVTDATGNDNIKASEVVVYDPAGEKPIIVTSSRVLVATITVTGETLPAKAAEAVTLTDVTLTTKEASYVPVVTTVDYGCTEHTCGHGTGTWTALTAEKLTELEYVLPTGNYYLTEDVTAAKELRITAKGAEVNLCLNGYTYTSPTAARLMNLDAENVVMNICDCTATGEGENLVAGKFLLKFASWGNLRVSKPGCQLTTTNIILQGAEDAVFSSASDNNVGNAATFYQGTSAAGSSIYVENVLIKDVNTSKTVIDTRAEGYYKNVTFVNCSGGQNTDTDKLAIFTTNGNHASSGTRALTIDGCKFIDCKGDVLDTNGKSGMTYTLKGDVQAEGAFYITKTCKVNLELGTNADVTIRTEEDKTEETIGSQVVIPEGATLSAGTLLYKNVDMMVEYKDGTFSWVGHAHKPQVFANGTEEGHTVEGLSFKPWDDSSALPSSGNWYLTTDVNMTAQVTIAAGSTLNLDLNGHTVTQTTAKARHFQVNGTLNLFDCQSGYDAEGNWVGGVITGGTHTTGASVAIERSATGETDVRPTFNMYGGRIAGNHTTSSGGAVYIYYSQTLTSGVKAGGIFNMYGGELYDNSSTAWGGAITVMGYSHTATSGSKGADPALGLGAQFNMHGGKIHGNETIKPGEVTGYGEGTINVQRDAQVTMTGGEICNNAAELGGAFFMAHSAAKVTITGGKIYGNSAVETEYKRTQYKLTTNTNGAATSHTVYMGKGGAFYCAGGTLTVKNIELSENNSTLGGALYATGGSATNVLIENCVIDGNSAMDPRTAKFDESVKNTSGAAYTGHNMEWGNGGAAYIYSGPTTVTFKDCQFTNNSSSAPANINAYCGAGGAIYTAYTKNLLIDGCTFTGNDSGNKAGAGLNLRHDGTTADVRNCVFTGNTTSNAGAGIYTVNSAILKLTDTVIYGNTNTGTLGGAGVYVTSKGGRIILSGKVVIDANTNRNGWNSKTDLFFQNQTTRTYLAEVNELGAGSSINLYFDTNATSTIITEDKAESYVKLTDGGTQSDWDCGWITASSKANTTGRQISYLDLTDDGVDNKTFEWGHYHKRADGTYYLLNAWTSTTSLPKTTDDNGVGYYLTGDVTVTGSAELSVSAHKTTGLDYELCLNGHNVNAAGSSNATIILRSANGWIGDCTASFDENGHLISGATISGSHKKENGGALYFTDDQSIGANVTVYGIELSGNYETAQRNGTVSLGYSGGAIHARNKSGTVDKTDVTVIGCKFTGNHTPMEGGAINSLNGADFTITDTVFEGNHAGRLGGAISMIGASGAKGELKLDNCRFVDNYATSGPTLVTDNADTTDVDESITPIKGTGQGGAIYATQTTVTVENCYFEGNQAINAEKLTNYNTSGQDIAMGGAIFMTSSAILNVDGSEFVDNHAMYEGGAIYYYGQTNSITNSTFTGNTADYYGGALFTLNTSCVLNVSDSVFTNNKSMGHTYTGTDGKAVTTCGYGGAIECMNGTTTLTNVEFIGNSARVGGGAVRLGGGGGSIKAYTVSNCYFAENSVTTGQGGALMNNARTATFAITNTDFVGNTAGNQGGAVYLKGDSVMIDTDADNKKDTEISVPNVNITGGSFVDNYAKNHAGAIHAATNTNVTVDGATFDSNESGEGGVICTGESKTVANFNNCEFTGNSAKNGGVGAHLWFKTVSYTGCTFTDNTATGNGGALYIRGNSDAVATIGGAGEAACTFTGNQAVSAGAVWCGSGTYTDSATQKSVYYKGNTNIINSTFTENVATNDVAAVRSSNGHQLTITDSTITNNTSKTYGALHVATSNASLTLAGKMVVTDNVSTNYAEFAENTDLFFRADDDATIDAKVDVSGLTDDSKIGVMAQDARMAQTTALTMNGGAAKSNCFYSNSERVILVAKDGEIHAVKYVAADGTIYGSVQAAIVAAEAANAETFQLQAPTTEELTLTTLDYIDLNGYDVAKITVPEGLTLNIVDSTTNDYDCSDGFGTVVVEGAYNAYVEDASSGSLKRYVVIADEDGKLSSHRVYLAITTKTLRPANNGVGFKAVFAGDEVVANSGIVYGIQLSGYSDFSQVLAASFDDMEPGAQTNTPNQKTVVIYDAINAEDTSRWDADLYGRPFITIGETTAYGKDVTVNMKAMAANALASGNQEVIDAVNAMMTECGVSAN